MSDTGTTPTNLYKALLQAQRSMGSLAKNANNPAFGGKKYADLGAVLEVIEEPLRANGLTFIQPIDMQDLRPVVRTILIHAESGEQLEWSAPVISKDPDDPQKFGAAVTYMRRYSLQSIFCLSAEDDDGQTASKPAPKPKAVTAPTPVQVPDITTQTNEQFKKYVLDRFTAKDDKTLVELVRQVGSDTERGCAMVRVTSNDRELDWLIKARNDLGLQIDADVVKEEFAQRNTFAK